MLHFVKKILLGKSATNFDDMLCLSEDAAKATKGGGGPDTEAWKPTYELL